MKVVLFDKSPIVYAVEWESTIGQKNLVECISENCARKLYAELYSQNKEVKLYKLIKNGQRKLIAS